MPSESDFLDWLRAEQRASELVRVPAGDDLAVLNWDGRDLLIVGADQVVDGVHFDSTIHTPRQIGTKAMNRNLSDCAAMACLPVAAIATVALPSRSGVEYAKELYLGLREAGDLFGCEIVGGDTGSWDGKLAMSVTILGRSAGIAPVTRSGARPGDGIFVTGALGGSILGRHMDFVPRVRLARQLAQTISITAMIDLSDGLSRDLARISTMSGAGARVRASDVPIHPDAVELSRRDARPALEHALHDGEDHELLFTTSAQPPEAIDGVAITKIGNITSDAAVTLEDPPGTFRLLEPKGWEHPL